MYRYICSILLMSCLASANLQVKWNDPDTCQTCVQFLNITRNELSSNATQQEIINVLDQACAQLGIYAPVCKSWVDENVQTLIDQLINQIDPVSICNKIGACQTKMVAIKKMVKLETPCLMCHLLLNATKNVFTDNTTETEILDILNLYCSALGPLAKPCHTFVNQNGPRIFELIAKNDDPIVICKDLLICQEANNRRVYKQTLKTLLQKADDSPCDTCHLVLDNIKDFISKNTTQEEFKKFVDLACLSYGVFYKQCQAFSDNHYKEIFQAIEDDIDPKVICSYIRLCPKETTTSPATSTATSPATTTTSS